MMTLRPDEREFYNIACGMEDPGNRPVGAVLKKAMQEMQERGDSIYGRYKPPTRDDLDGAVSRLWNGDKP